jgi:NADPH:quinone reductase-like Zn-dependent oxidoreductase
MNAVYFSRHGGLDVLAFGERPTPVPAPGQVLVRVKACALNRLDVWVRQGLPGVAVTLPHIPGCDVAGLVEGTGEKALVSPGLSCGLCVPCREERDHLCDSFGILGQNTPGGYAEFVAVPAANLFPLPPNASFTDAAAFPLVFLTAWQMLVSNAQITTGETVLVHAGGSGVGTAAIQIAKSRGARVLTTVGSDAKIPKVTALGADKAINYNTSDFVEETRRWTGGRGVDVVLDHVGGSTWEKSLSALARGGRLTTCGATAGRHVSFDLRSLFGGNIRVLGSRLGNRGSLAAALALWREGRLRPVVDSVFPLREAAAAQRRLESRDTFGKVVLTVD